MNGQGKLLTHFLKNADKLVIPVYQRNYDWKEEHCKKLYSDLVKTFREGKVFFRAGKSGPWGRLDPVLFSHD